MDARPTILLFSLLLASTADADIYISKLNGNDSNSGSSPESAWSSLSMLEGIDVSATNNIFLERGSVFADERLLLLNATSIAIAAYGNESHPRPQIAHLTNPYRLSCISLGNPNGVTVESLHISGCYNGILLYTTSPSTVSSNIIIRDNFFRDLLSPDAVQEPAFAEWVSAVMVGRGARLQNLTVSNNFATRIESFYRTNQSFVESLYLRENTVSACYGNCVQFISGTDQHLQDSVFLRDAPSRLFLYGTTDLILGTIKGNNSVVNSDFNARGEFEGGPDGCAVDFETSSDGFRISGNTFYKSYGAGIMLMGHADSPHNFEISYNNFFHTGCAQAAGDHGSITLMCPGGTKPGGSVIGNNFGTCKGIPAITVPFPGCDDDLTMKDNLFEGLDFIPEPQINLNPPPVSQKAAELTALFTAKSINGTYLRYTLDGSRPTMSSPIFPQNGLNFVYPGPALAVNVRAFPNPAYESAANVTIPSITNGMIIDRSRYAVFPLPPKPATKI